MNTFIKISNDCYMNKRQIKIYDTIIPCNTICYIANNEKTIYFCAHFPKNYNGNPKNIILNVVWYDYELRTIGITTLKNCDVSIALYNAWIKANKPRPQKIHHENTLRDYEKMMGHSHVKKSSGGVRLSSRLDETTTDNLRYKQNSVYAYHSQYLHTYDQVL